MPIAGEIISLPIIVVPSGGTAGITTGTIALGVADFPPDIPLVADLVDRVVVEAIQITGLIPLSDCSVSDCRTFEAKCYLNPVFGDYISPRPSIPLGYWDSYTNDINSFILQDNFKRDLIWTIQKLDIVTNKWVDTFNFSYLHGAIYDYGFFTKNPYYTGITLDWGKVVDSYGAGIYRVRVHTIESTTSFSGRCGGETSSGVYAQGSGIFSDVVASIVGGGFEFDTAVTATSRITLYDITGAVIGYTTCTFTGTGTGGDSVILSGTCTATIYTDVVVSFPISGTLYALTTPIDAPINFCKVSEPFDLKSWNCNQADRTVKFQTTSSGMIGDCEVAGNVFDLTSGGFYDSIRVKGKFSDMKPSYEESVLEYQTGLIDQVRDKRINTYKFF